MKFIEYKSEDDGVFKTVPIHSVSLEKNEKSFFVTNVYTRISDEVLESTYNRIKKILLSQ